MASAQVLDPPTMSTAHSSRSSLASIALRWMLANVLPQALLVAAAWAYLGVNGLTLAGLTAPGGLTKLPNPLWFIIATAALYVVMTVWTRGAIVRPLVPRFSILGWVPAALLSSVVMLAVTATGSLIGLAVSKGLAMSGSHAPTVPVPTGLAFAPFVLGIFIGAEFIGLIIGGLPGLIVGAGEALAACRGTRSKAAWILWTAAAWSMIATIITLHAFVPVFYPEVPSGVLIALAVATPILLGLAAALLTLPALAKLARQQAAAV
jgi:hypothetical protein